MEITVVIDSEIAFSNCRYDFKDREIFDSDILLNCVAKQIANLKEMHKDHAVILAELESENQNES